MKKRQPAFLQERLTNNESVVFIAFANGIVSGFCQLYPIFSSVGLQRTWLLNDLYVHEKARGQGVAAALLQQAKEFGIATNARWLMLETAADNFTAQSVYEKNGWKRVEDYFYELGLWWKFWYDLIDVTYCKNLTYTKGLIKKISKWKAE